jgi:6-phosphogluconolactonase
MIVAMDTAPEIRIVEDAEELAETAAGMIVDLATSAVAQRGRFTIALAGGETPRATYERLARQPLSEVMPWARTFVFFGDERGVPADHPDSNYGMAHRALLAKVPIPPRQIFRIPGDGSDPEAVATEYARTIGEELKARRGEVPRLDLVLLGVGIDGHTASLFPGSPVLKEVFRTVAAVHAAAAVIPQRFTLTFPILNAAACVVFLVSGGVKAKVVKAALAEGTATLPAGMVRPSDGRLIWLLDRAAAALLPASGARPDAERK